jgi:hypothetical protein
LKHIKVAPANRLKRGKYNGLQKAPYKHRASTRKAQNKPRWYPITGTLLLVPYYLLPITVNYDGMARGGI